MLFVQGTPMTAVVRGSTGEPVILLSGKQSPTDGERSSDDLVRAALAVLDSDELRLFRATIKKLSASSPDFQFVEDGTVLVVYKVAKTI
ncbi:hypothetical protein [Streptomyces heilongjiangensis]|uniref:Uncharacterized protein n=1 Tax=Streptomyces heilongjiangensis TaxID=945052 RepID=A0ABW1B9W2_9ACTN|nr:hypothetical protein [Streptomyces heilongjiangensis]MDC2951590.1 hypothetical protein [Streptomyces heilongjiangensis]